MSGLTEHALRPAARYAVPAVGIDEQHGERSVYGRRAAKTCKIAPTYMTVNLEMPFLCAAAGKTPMLAIVSKMANSIRISTIILPQLPVTERVCVCGQLKPHSRARSKESVETKPTFRIEYPLLPPKPQQ
jgi:hypothetical protein